MKKIKYLLLLILFIPLNIYATEVSIKDLDMQITVGDEWLVFTRDNLSDEKIQNYLQEQNIPEKNIMNNMENIHSYFDGIKGNNEFIIRSVVNDDVNNLSNYSQEDLELFGTSLNEKTEATTFEIIKYNDITYIKTEYYDESAKANILEYVTIVNRNCITYTIQNYEDKIDDETKKEIDEIIKSIHIKIDPKYKSEENFFQQFFIIGAVAFGIIIVSVVILIIVKKKIKDISF